MAEKSDLIGKFRFAKAGILYLMKINLLKTGHHKIELSAILDSFTASYASRTLLLQLDMFGVGKWYAMHTLRDYSDLRPYNR